MRTVIQIIEMLDGPASIARDTGIPLTTVDSWKRNGFVPEWRRAPLVDLAKRRGVSLSLTDFPTERPTEQARDAA